MGRLESQVDRATNGGPMRTVAAIYIAPVKSLALLQSASVEVGYSGIADDRRFHLIDGGGRLLTQRQRPRLAQVAAVYAFEAERLSLTFPDGQHIEGRVSPGEAVVTQIWGRRTPGRLVEGPWNALLSELCRGPVRLVKTDNIGQSFDEYPVSLLSQASIDLLDKRAAGAVDFESKRFRPNFLIDGCSPNEEDFWLGGIIRIGPELRLRVTAPDPRCAITTVNPETGERDFDTPRLLLTYRPSFRAPCFGVYATVESPGAVAVGDTVEVATSSPHL